MRTRLLLGLMGAAILPVSPAVALPIIIIGELHERLLFFRSVWAPKMTHSKGSVTALTA